MKTKKIKYHKCATAGCKTKLSEGSPKVCPECQKCETPGDVLIWHERVRQYGKGYNTDRDAAYTQEELIRAAGAHLILASQNEPLLARAICAMRMYPFNTPLKGVSPKQHLIKAGALIAAEIDRMNRAELAAKGKKK